MWITMDWKVLLSLPMITLSDTMGCVITEEPMIASTCPVSPANNQAPPNSPRFLRHHTSSTWISVFQEQTICKTDEQELPPTKDNMNTLNNRQPSESDDMEIELGPCSSEISAAHRERLRINRFTWHEILKDVWNSSKISISGLNFYAAFAAVAVVVWLISFMKKTVIDMYGMRLNNAIAFAGMLVCLNSLCLMGKATPINVQPFPGSYPGSQIQPFPGSYPGSQIQPFPGSYPGSQIQPFPGSYPGSQIQPFPGSQIQPSAPFGGFIPQTSFSGLIPQNGQIHPAFKLSKKSSSLSSVNESPPIRCRRTNSDDECSSGATQEAKRLKIEDNFLPKIDQPQVLSWLTNRFDLMSSWNHMNDQEFLTKNTDYGYSTYFMENTVTNQFYVGTKFGHTDKPCEIWDEQVDGLYTSQRVNDVVKYKYLGSVTYKGNANPYSSDSMAEGHAMYTRLLQEVGHKLLPAVYKKAANLQLRRTGVVWELSELNRHIIDDINNRRQMLTSIPPPNRFFKDISPTFPTSSQAEDATYTHFPETDIISSILATLSNYNLNVQNERTVTEFPNQLPLAKYQENIELSIKSQPAAAYSLNAPPTKTTNENVGNEDLDLVQIVRRAGKVYATTYYMQNVETGGIYPGSKVGHFAKPCVIWEKIQGTELYKSTRINDEGSVYIHVQSFLWSSTSADYTEILKAADSHAAFSQLFLQAGNHFKPNIYPKSVNIKNKVKPMLWTPDELAKAITEAINEERSVLQIIPPKSRFINDKETILESVLEGNVMVPYVEEDMILAVMDYEAGLSVLEASQMNNIPPFNLLETLKRHDVKLRDQSSMITREDINAALSLLEIQDDNGEKVYSAKDVIELYPRLSEAQIKRYQENPSLINYIPLSQELIGKIINVIRAGAKTTDIIQHFKVPPSTVHRLIRYVRRATDLMSLYGEPDFATAEIMEPSPKYTEEQLAPAYTFLRNNPKCTFKEAAKLVPGLTAKTLSRRFKIAYPEIHAQLIMANIHQSNKNVYSDDDLLEVYQCVLLQGWAFAYKALREKEIRMKYYDFTVRFNSWRRLNNIPSIQSKSGRPSAKDHSDLELACRAVNDPTNTGRTKKEKLEHAYKRFPELNKKMKLDTFSAHYRNWIKLHPEFEIEDLRHNNKQREDKNTEEELEEIYDFMDTLTGAGISRANAAIANKRLGVKLTASVLLKKYVEARPGTLKHKTGNPEKHTKEEKLAIMKYMDTLTGTNVQRAKAALSSGKMEIKYAELTLAREYGNYKKNPQNETR